MKVVIDTNVLLMSLPTVSKYRPIFDGLINNVFQLAISNEILSEYVEIIEQKTTPLIAKNVAELLLSLKNVQQTQVYFNWDLIKKDNDDNKFVDCAIAANVKFVVSNDRHFRILKRIDFPNVEVVTADEFLKEIAEF